MHLPYRPKFLPHTRTPFASKPAPEPFVAPAALYGEDPRRPYLPRLAADHGVVLFRDGHAGDWPKGRAPAAPLRKPSPPVWVMVFQVLLILAAIGWSAVVQTGGGQ